MLEAWEAPEPPVGNATHAREGCPGRGTNQRTAETSP